MDMLNLFLNGVDFRLFRIQRKLLIWLVMNPLPKYIADGLERAKQYDFSVDDNEKEGDENGK